LRKELSEKDAELAALELEERRGSGDHNHVELLRHERFKLLSQIKSEDERRIRKQ